MSLISTLIYGPEYALAENLTRRSTSFSSVSVDSYTADSRSDVQIVQAMRLIYARHKIHETSYVTPLAQTKTVIHAGAAVQSRFSKSDSPTEFYLVDHSVVVSTVKPAFGQSSQRGGVRQDDTLKMTISFGVLDQPLKELTGPLYKIQLAATQRFESMYLSLIALSMGVGAANAMLFLATTTLFTKAIFISLIGLQVLVAYRIYQLSPLKEKVSKWQDFGQFASQIRRWSYEYPALSASNPFLLQQEKQGLAH